MEQFAEVASWFMTCVVFACIGLTVKPLAVAAHKHRPTAFTKIFLATLRLHPVCAGVALGFVPGIPVAAFAGDASAARSLYFASAGAVCTYVYDFVRAKLKQRGSRDSTAGES